MGLNEQHGYSVNATKFSELKRKTDTQSRRVVKLVKRLLDNTSSYEELTKQERQLVNASGCFNPS